jgi:hypothetical protein
MPPQNISQINNFISIVCNKKFGATTINLDELEVEWCMNNSAKPNDFDQFFVLAHEINHHTAEPNFKFVVTTIRLFTQSSSSVHLHTDTTYKLNWAS